MSGANGAALAFSDSIPELDDELAGNKRVLSPLLRGRCDGECSQAEQERGYRQARALCASISRGL